MNLSFEFKLYAYWNLTVGAPIRYGEAEPWKKIAAKIGRTHPVRAPGARESRRKKNDGRAPDTNKELTAIKVQKSTKESNAQSVISIPT